LSGYVILMLVGVGMYLLIAMLLTLDEFTEHSALSFGQMFSMMIDFYGHNVPAYYAQLGGPMMAVAAAFTLGRMLRNNELTALVAAGMPLQRLIAPLAVGSLALVGVWLANRELLMPRLAAEIARTPDDMVGATTRGVYSVRDDRDATLTALALDARDGRLRHVFIIEPPGEPTGAGQAPGAHGSSRSLIVADAAQYDDSAGLWRLTRGVRMMMADPASAAGLGPAIREDPIDEYDFELTPQQLVLRRRSQWADLLSWRELNALAMSPNLPNRAVVEMSRHVRLAQPMLQFLLLLLTIPFFLTREPENVLAAGGRALLASGALYLVAFLTQGLVADANLAALLAWSPILIFGPFVVLLLGNLRT